MAQYFRRSLSLQHSRIVLPISHTTQLLATLDSSPFDPPLPLPSHPLLSSTSIHPRSERRLPSIPSQQPSGPFRFSLLSISSIRWAVVRDPVSSTSACVLCFHLVVLLELG